MSTIIACTRTPPLISGTSPRSPSPLAFGNHALDEIIDLLSGE
jgi:hypothetical protein